jgi:hypothetical protein
MSNSVQHFFILYILYNTRALDVVQKCCKFQAWVQAPRTSNVNRNTKYICPCTSVREREDVL